MQTCACSVKKWISEKISDRWTQESRMVAVLVTAFGNQLYRCFAIKIRIFLKRDPPLIRLPM
jgi:hypothetical protein